MTEQKKTTDLAVIGKEEFAILQAGAAEQLPALIRENVGPDAITPFDLDRIKIPSGGGGAFELPGIDGGETAKEFTGVIIYHRQGRVYWAEEYAGVGNPPDCSSNDGITGQGEPGGECSQCPMAAWSSADRGRGQACKAVKQLFVVLPDSLLPVCLSLPPTSLAVARKFLLRLAGRGLPYYAVAVTFGLEKTKNADGIEYSRVTMKTAERLTPEQVEQFKSLSASLKPHLQAVEVGADDYAAADGENDIPV